MVSENDTILNNEVKNIEIKILKLTGQICAVTRIMIHELDADDLSHSDIYTNTINIFVNYIILI